MTSTEYKLLDLLEKAFDASLAATKNIAYRDKCKFDVISILFDTLEELINET